MEPRPLRGPRPSNPELPKRLPIEWRKINDPYLLKPARPIDVENELPRLIDQGFFIAAHSFLKTTQEKDFKARAEALRDNQPPPGKITVGGSPQQFKIPERLFPEEIDASDDASPLSFTIIDRNFHGRNIPNIDDYSSNFEIFVNPRIISFSEGLPQISTEGCQSFLPDDEGTSITSLTRNPSKIIVEALVSSDCVNFEKKRVTLEGAQAQLFLHENAHMKGEYFASSQGESSQGEREVLEMLVIIAEKRGVFLERVQEIRKIEDQAIKSSELMSLAREWPDKLDRERCLDAIRRGIKPRFRDYIARSDSDITSP